MKNQPVGLILVLLVAIFASIDKTEAKCSVDSHMLDDEKTLNKRCLELFDSKEWKPKEKTEYEICYMSKVRVMERLIEEKKVDCTGKKTDFGDCDLVPESMAMGALQYYLKIQGLSAAKVTEKINKMKQCFVIYNPNAKMVQAYLSRYAGTQGSPLELPVKSKTLEIVTKSTIYSLQETALSEEETVLITQQGYKGVGIGFSGGGIRAAMGTLLVFKYLKLFNLESKYDYTASISGGTWGVVANRLKNGDVDGILAAYKEAAKNDLGPGGIGLATAGDVLQLHRIVNRASSWHFWKNQVEEKVFRPLGIDASKSITTISAPVGKYDVYELAKTGIYSRSTEEKCDFSYKWIRCSDYQGDITLVEKEVSRFRFDHPLKIQDWFSLTSSAFMATKVVVTPQIRDKNIKKYFRFKDAGINCNLPLHSFFVQSRRIKKVIMFDFSYFKKDKEDPSTEIQKFFTQEKGLDKTHIIHYCDEDTCTWKNSWMNVIKSNPVIFHVPLYGYTKKIDLIHDFPTVSLGSPVQWTVEMFDLFVAEYGGFLHSRLKLIFSEMEAMN